MSDDQAAHIDAHVRIALVVFGALMGLTGATVAAWALLDLSTPMTIALALAIALVKGTLVACWFMHLISEKKMIFMTLIMTVGFFFMLLLVPAYTSITDHASIAGPLPTPAAATEDHSGH